MRGRWLRLGAIVGMLLSCTVVSAVAATDPATSPPPLPDTTTAPTDSSPASPVTRTVLPNGMRIVVRREPDTPLIAVDVFVRVGSGQEKERTSGIGSFVARTLLASTSSRRPETINDEIADLGGNVQVSRQPDWTELSALTVPDKFNDLSSLLTDVIKNATFDSEVVEQKRNDIRGDIDSGEASVFDRAYNNLRGGLFAGTGYGLPTLGTTRSILRLQRTELLRYYYEYFIPKNMVFVVVGDIDPQTAIDRITTDMESFDPLIRGSRRPEPVQTPLPILTADVPPVHAYQSDLAEVCVMAGFRAPSMSSEDYAALQVLNALLGGMKTSRMFTNLREKQGLAYELGSFYSPQLYAGDLTGFVFAASSRSDSGGKKGASPVAVIKEQLLQQFASMQATPPTSVELARAKRYLIGTYLIKHERIEDRATILGIAELTSVQGAQMDEDYPKFINAVTAADVVRVAKKYLVHPVISTIEPDPHTGGSVSE